MKILVSALVLALGLSSVSFAKRNFRGPDDYFRKNKDRNYASEKWVQKPGSASSNDSDLVRAVRDRRQIHFVESGQVTVSQILPDDNQGLRHQRWFVRLSDGSVVFAVYNIDMEVDKVPVAVGQEMSLGGEFKWTSNGGLLHWLHADPRKQRPDGYVVTQGQRYGDLK